MTPAFQLICRLEQTCFSKTISPLYFGQLSQKHRKAKKSKDKSKDEVKCLEPRSKKKKSFWSFFKGSPDPECFEKEKIDPKECETVPRVSEKQVECDLERLSEEGQAYRTCGTAYILQKDYIETEEIEVPPEQQILNEMLKDPSLKGQSDPMPPFESVEKRLLELSERKLHPLYKMLMSIPKRPRYAKSQVTPYKTRFGPVLPDEIPEHLKINRETFDKKNIFIEFKKADPPQQIIARLAEMKINEKPTMEKKNTSKIRNKQEDCFEAQ